MQDQSVRLLTQELQHGVAALGTLTSLSGRAGAGGPPSTPSKDATGSRTSVAVRSPGSTPSLSPALPSPALSPPPIVEAAPSLSWEWVEQQLLDVSRAFFWSLLCAGPAHVCCALCAVRHVFVCVRVCVCLRTHHL